MLDFLVYWCITLKSVKSFSVSSGHSHLSTQFDCVLASLAGSWTHIRTQMVYSPCRSRRFEPRPRCPVSYLPAYLAIG